MPSPAKRQEPETAAARVLSDIHLLQLILDFLDQEELLQTAPYVNKAFAAACGSPGACWRVVEVDGLRVPWLSRRSDKARLFWSRVTAWIARRASGMRSLHLHNLRHLLSPLEPPEQAAVLAGVWAALAPSGSLRHLELSRSTITLPPGAVAAITTLTTLQELDIFTAGPMAYSEIDDLAGSLPLLERLSVWLLRRRGQLCVFSGAFPAKLTQLKHLRELHLEGPYSGPKAGPCQLPECIGEWGQTMEQLWLLNLGLERLPASIGKLRCLQSLRLGRNHLGSRPDALPQEMTQLTALTCLELHYNGFDAGPPPIVGHLTSLVELDLSGNLWGSTCRDMPREYSQLRKLWYLNLTNCELRVLPPVVATLSRLDKLELNINKLKTLPGGPYLKNLSSIRLLHNRFKAGYPRALADAPQLCGICFEFRGKHFHEHEDAVREALAPQEHAEPAPLAAAAAVAAVAAVAVLALPAP